MLNLVLFGPPGSGKGTQATKIIDKYNLVHISTGDILRSEVGNATELGLEAKKFMDQGLLVPDEVVIGMLGNKIDASMADGAQGFIFDGFPRTVPQAKALDQLLEDKQTAISQCLALEVDNEELVKRILNRGKTSGRSDDQDEHIIRNRILQYEENTMPVANYYDGQDKYKALEGVGTIEDIFQSLCNEIDAVV